MAGVVASVAIVIAGWWIIPEYRKEVYEAAWVFLAVSAIPAAFVAFLYITYIDQRMDEPYDGLWHFGRVVMGKPQGVDIRLVVGYLKSVLLRGYYLPIMIVLLAYYLSEILHGGFGHFAEISGFSVPDKQDAAYHLEKIFVGIWFFFASMDVLFGLMGYITVFRALDSHIRSVEPTFFGWFICLICYSPFWEGFIIPFLLYDLFKAPQWYNWMSAHSGLAFVWGLLVIAGMICESLVTLTFGMRFSNLSYRGLMSAGPYRLTRHPQYVAKAANRFFFLVPFLSPLGPAGALKRMLMFGIFCAIYFFRARTEENHLSRYPEYVEYAKWVDEHGWFRGLGRIFPSLKYSEERARAGRLF